MRKMTRIRRASADWFWQLNLSSDREEREADRRYYLRGNYAQTKGEWLGHELDMALRSECEAPWILLNNGAWVGPVTQIDFGDCDYGMFWLVAGEPKRSWLIQADEIAAVELREL